MAPRAQLTLSFLASATLIAASAAWAGHVREGGWQFTMTLSGAVEVPPGDPDGTGTFTAVVNPGQKRICYDITVTGIDPAPFGAHIHFGAAGTAGDIVIPLATPPLGSSSACVTATSRQLAQIIAKPELYYVNVHNTTHPAGAIRGQFSRPAH